MGSWESAIVAHACTYTHARNPGTWEWKQEGLLLSSPGSISQPLSPVSKGKYKECGLIKELSPNICKAGPEFYPWRCQDGGCGASEKKGSWGRWQLTQKNKKKRKKSCPAFARKSCFFKTYFHCKFS